MPQKFVKIAISVLVLFGIIYYVANFETVNKLTQGVFASNPPAVVDVKLKISADGVAPFDATPNDNSALTDPGDDQDILNGVVRGGDTVSYRIFLNSLNLDSSDATAVVTLDRGTWLALPAICLTTTTSPAVLSTKTSSISSDGRTLICNTGIIVEGTADVIDAVARADNTPNNTPLIATISASSTGSAVKTAPAVQVVITARPQVDLVKYVNSSVTGATTTYEPAYERSICKNGTTYTTYDLMNPAACTGVGDVKGDNVIYNFKIAHAKLGSEQLASPFNVTLDDTFTYVNGQLGGNNATLVSCSVVSGYSASSGTINCGIPNNVGLNKKTVITISGVDDTKTGGDGIIGNYSTKYFVPHTDYAPNTTLNLSNLITARSSAGAAVDEAGWDPLSATGVSNYGSAGNEKTNTCATDPGAGSANSATCNNRVDLPLVYVTPGSYCRDTISSGLSTFQGCGGAAKGNTFVAPGQIHSILSFSEVAVQSLPDATLKEITCNVASIDSAGNLLFEFTGNISNSNPYGFSPIQQVAFYSLPLPYGYEYYRQHNDNTILPIDTNQIGHTMANTFNTPVIEFSTTPISGNIPGTSDRISDCADSVGNWQKWSGNGSISTSAPITRMRVTYNLKGPRNTTEAHYVYTDVKINSNSSILSGYCATNPAGPNCAIPVYSSYHLDSATGVQIANWTPSSGGAINNTAGSATNTAFQTGGQDLMYVAPSIIRINKSNDKPIANPGDVINFTVTPSYVGAGTSTLTVTDTLLAGLTFVPGSYPANCTTAGQVMTCTYPNATAGTSLNPAVINYKAKVDNNISNADLNNYVTISSSNNQVNIDSNCAVQFQSFCDAVSRIQVRTPGAYYLEKRLISPSVDEVDQDLKYDLAIKNLGSQALGQQEYIEVFPFNGDNGNFTFRVSNPPPSNYSGTVEYKSVTVPAGVTVVAYTTDAPNTIKLDPKCKSNTSAANWIDGTPTISNANQQGTDWVNYCGSSDTATNWILSSTPPANATAIKFSSAAIPANSATPIINLTLHAKNNHEGDRYTNNWSGRSTTIDLPVVSNDVSSTVIDGSIGDRVWNDVNKDGVQDAGENGFNLVPVSLTWYGVDGILGNADDMTWTTTTDSNGNYLFKYLPSGKYDVTVTTPPAGFGQTYDLDGVGTAHKISTTLSNTTDAVGNVLTVQDRVDADFGYAGYKIEGDVWVDLNKDLLHAVLPSCGVADPLTTECGVPSVGVALNDATTGATIQTTTTDGLGHYKFTNIPNGTYNIVETQPNAYTSESINILPTTVANVDITGKDFAELPAQLSGCVYVDANNNGIKEVAETPIPTVTIKLTGNDVDGNVVNQTATTDALGCYSFPSLRAGNFAVAETQPAAYVDGKDTAGTTGGVVTNDNITNISLGAGANSQNNNFGEIDPAKLGDFVWEDNNANGVQDAGELGIAGAVVTLTDTAGNPVADALGVAVAPITTPASGAYQFTNLIPGSYKVNFVLPAGYTMTTKDVPPSDTKDSDADTVTGTTATVTLVPGQNNPDIDDGGYRKVKLGDYVWFDLNHDGIQDATEVGIDNVKVELRDAGGVVIQTQTTTGGGKYLFTNLTPGVYTVKFTKPIGLTTSPKNVGAVATDSDADLVTGVTSNITLVSGVDNLTIDAGYYGHQVEGDVWVDLNKDLLHGVLPTCGTTDPLTTECGVPTVTIDLKDATNATIQTTTTDALGHYKFTNLIDGNYTIVETQPSAYITETPDTISITIAGADQTGKDFAELPAQLSGYVYVDANDDGIKDTGELAIQTVTVKLTGTDVDGNVVSQSTTTDATGYYSFTNLRAGTFTVTETQPAAYLDGKDTAGSMGGVVTNDVIATISLTPGSNSENNNFGELYKGRITGCVYADYDVNEKYVNPPDQVIPAVNIELQNSSNVALKSQTTDANGCYDFTNLPDGTYQVKETQPTSYLNGKNFVNTPPTFDGNDDLISQIIITSNTDDNNNFSEYPNSSLCGIVYHDKNKSSTQMPDANEEGLEAWTLTLTGSLLTSSRTTLTDSQGRYCFNQLIPGSYTVTETQNSNYTSTYNDDNVEVVAVTSVPATNINFGEIKLGRILGVVWNDSDKSGTKDSLEVTGVPGAVIEVTNSSDKVVDTVTTDNTGNYEVGGLLHGVYKVTVKLPDTWKATTTEILGVTVSEVDGKADYGAVKKLSDTGADYTLMMIGFAMIMLTTIIVVKKYKF